MSTRIISNGSKWAGEKPDSLQKLIHRLKKHPLTSRYNSGSHGHKFCGRDKTGYFHRRFFGNFHGLSAVFNIHTDDPRTIATLSRLMAANYRRQRAVSSLKTEN